MHMLKAVLAIIYQAHAWCQALCKGFICPESFNLHTCGVDTVTPFDTGRNCCPRNCSSILQSHITSQGGSFLSLEGRLLSLVIGAATNWDPLFKCPEWRGQLLSPVTGGLGQVVWGTGGLRDRRFGGWAVWGSGSLWVRQIACLLSSFSHQDDSRNLASLVHHCIHTTWHVAGAQ